MTNKTKQMTSNIVVITKKMRYAKNNNNDTLKK